MLSFVESNICLITILSIIHQTSALAYNQPKFCSNASWNPNAITFTNTGTIYYYASGIFVNINNTVYVTDPANSRVLIWLEGNTNPTRIISGDLYYPYSVFVTTIGDIYVDNGDWKGRVDKWTANATNSTPAMYVSGSCYGLFVDINDNLYCSMADLHQVVMRSVNSSLNTVVSGTGCSGMTSYMLYYPYGIFVDVNFNLYVADGGNNRIQLFRAGQLSGTTVVGNGVSPSITLYWPTGVVLDADGYLFIVDRDNCRIVRSGPNGFSCLVGCSGCGSASNQLSYPWTLSFDSYGNIFVTDTNNNRIQKFLLAINSCNETRTLQQTMTTTINPEETSVNAVQFINLSTSTLRTIYTNNFSSRAVSYNRPKFCSNASWNPNAITFTNTSTNFSYAMGMFVNSNNTVYVTDPANSRVLIWLEGNTNPTRIISGDLYYPYSVFVTTIGDIYVDNGDWKGRVDKWTANATNSTPAMYVSRSCFGLFVDINDNLYCSMADLHQVVMRSVNSSLNTVVSGTGCSGMTSYMLYYPYGIFVDVNFNLYVADGGNNRIQLFRAGQLSGTTVVGNGVSPSITLYWPTGVVLDADGYLFIVDRDNCRIVRSGPNGFSCLVGCSGCGSASAQLFYPWTLSFDSYSNIFVTNAYNNRIQKFLLATNSCDETTTSQSMMTTSVNNGITTRVTDTTDNVNIFFKNSTVNYSTISSTTTNSPATAFVPPSCPNQNQIGIGCKTSANPCDLLQPCQNNGTCNNDNTTPRGYICSCPSGFNGINCQIDIRPCKPNTCWNNGICNETSTTTFICLCQPGWIGTYCETKINYCENVKCLNNGVCRPLLLNFTCECSGASYSGRYCEITATKIIIHQTTCRSFAYVAILFLVVVVLFIITMDVLTYVFKIDPAKDEFKKRVKKRKAPPVIQRFVYVNRPPSVKTTKISISTIEETTV